jgi:hypothetical protein
MVSTSAIAPKPVVAPSIVATSAVTASVIASAGTAYMLTGIVTRPPGLEPGYHLPHDHHDAVAATLVLAFAGVGLMVTVPEITRTWWRSTFRL